MHRTWLSQTRCIIELYTTSAKLCIRNNRRWNKHISFASILICVLFLFLCLLLGLSFEPQRSAWWEPVTSGEQFPRPASHWIMTRPWGNLGRNTLGRPYVVWSPDGSTEFVCLSCQFFNMWICMKFPDRPCTAWLRHWFKKYCWGSWLSPLAITKFGKQQVRRSSVLDLYFCHMSLSFVGRGRDIGTSAPCCFEKQSDCHNFIENQKTLGYRPWPHTHNSLVLKAFRFNSFSVQPTPRELWIIWIGSSPSSA